MPEINYFWNEIEDEALFGVWPRERERWNDGARVRMERTVGVRTGCLGTVFRSSRIHYCSSGSWYSRDLLFIWMARASISIPAIPP